MKAIVLTNNETGKPGGPDGADRDSDDGYRLLVETSPDAILVACEDEIVYANPAALRLFGAVQPEGLLGRALSSLATPSLAALDDMEQGGPIRAMEEQVLRLDGTVVDVAVTRLPFRFRGKPAVHIVARDISERKRLIAQLRHQATHDALTGLPNRNLLIDRLHLAIAEARRYQGRFMVAFIDLDRFKWINDSFGHDAGDTLLKTVSRRMSACLRESDTIARIGGDEFVLLLRDSGNGEESMQILERVINCVAQPMTLKGHEVSVTCSIGCCSYPEQGEDPETLLRFSDAAMYRAKRMERNKPQRHGMNLPGRRFEERNWI